MRTDKRVSAIVKKEDKLLLDHRKKEGREYWVVLGGGIEESETLEQGLTREVMEETSLNLTKHTLIAQNTDQDGIEHYFYVCELSKGKPTLSSPEVEENGTDNSHHLEWINKADIAKLSLYPEHLKNLLSKIFS